MFGTPCFHCIESRNCLEGKAEGRVILQWRVFVWDGKWVAMDEDSGLHNKGSLLNASELHLQVAKTGNFMLCIFATIQTASGRIVETSRRVCSAQPGAGAGRGPPRGDSSLANTPSAAGRSNYHRHLTVPHSLNWGLCHLAPVRSWLPCRAAFPAVIVFSDHHGRRTAIICLNLIASSTGHWLLGITACTEFSWFEMFPPTDFLPTPRPKPIFSTSLV